MEKNLSSFLHYLIPGLLSVVLLSAYIFTDGFVVGQKLGSVALGAMGICTPILTISYAFGAMFGMGGGSLYSIEIGKNDKNKARRIFSTVVIFALLLSTIFVTINVLCKQNYRRGKMIRKLVKEKRVELSKDSSLNETELNAQLKAYKLELKKENKINLV